MRCKKRSIFVILPRLFLYFAYTGAITLLKSFEYAASNSYVEYSIQNRDGPAAGSDLVRFQFIRTWFEGGCLSERFPSEIRLFDRL